MGVMKGEVVAFDPTFRVVIIKTAGPRPGHSNVSIVNLAHCAEIKVDEEGKEVPGELQSLNTQKLQQRLRDQIERKKKLITAFKAGISPEGQKLFQVINKTLDDVTWNGDKIVVMRDVTIDPPYRPDTIRGKEDSKALKYIRQIVEKHMSDQEASKVPVPSTGPSSMSSSVTSVESTPVTTAAAAGAAASRNTSNTSSTPPTSVVTTTIPNLPQASAPPSNSHPASKPGGAPTGGGPRSNRNNAGRKQHHDHHHSKPMYNQ